MFDIIYIGDNLYDIYDNKHMIYMIRYDIKCMTLFSYRNNKFSMG